MFNVPISYFQVSIWLIEGQSVQLSLNGKVIHISALRRVHMRAGIKLCLLMVQMLMENLVAMVTDVNVTVSIPKTRPAEKSTVVTTCTSSTTLK